MAEYWRHGPGLVTPRKPPVGPLKGGQLAKRTRANAVIKAQDFVAGLGRRVLGALSIRGENTAWLVPDTNPDAATNTHPLDTTGAREVMRFTARLTPGMLPRLSVLCVPSGETQTYIGTGDYDPAGPGGIVRLVISWNYPGGTASETTHDLTLPASQLQYGAAPDDPWEAMHVLNGPIVTPDNLGPTLNLWRWSRHTEIAVTMSFIDSPRVLDACVYEAPAELAREADDDSDQWVSHMLAQQEPGGSGSVSWPYQRISETSPDGDPRGGTWHIADVAEAQHLRLGPQLVAWHAYNESDADIAGTVVSVTSSSVYFQCLWSSSQSTYNVDEPGFSLSCAGYARGYGGNHPYWSETDGAIPVLIAVRAMGDTVTGTVRVQTSASHYYDMAITTTASWGWFYGYTWIRASRGPGQPTNCQIFIRRDSGSNAFEVSNVTIHHSGQYDPLH